MVLVACMQLLLVACGSSSTPSLVTISITPTAASITSGTVQAFKATGTYSDSTTVDLSTQVMWSTGSASVATISNDAGGSSGQSTAEGVGTTSISASLGNVSGMARITVAAARAHVYLSTNIGGAYQLWQWAENADGSLTSLATPYITVSGLPALVTQNPGEAIGPRAVGIAGSPYVLLQTSIPGVSYLSVARVASNGSLVPSAVSPMSVGTDVAVAAHPSEPWFYTESGTSITHFSVNADGVITQVGTPLAIPSTLAATGVAIHPSGNFLYALNARGLIYQFNIAVDGTPSPMATPSVGADVLNARTLRVDPTGKMLYFLSNGAGKFFVDGLLNGMPIAADGSVSSKLSSDLCHNGPGNLPLQSPFNLDLAVSFDFGYSLSPNGQEAYLSCGDQAIYPVGIAAGGALTQASTPVLTFASQHDGCLTLDPTGSFAHVLELSQGVIEVYAVGADGSLQATGARTPIPTGSGLTTVTNCLVTIAP